jgi:beta-galactosidase
LMVPRSKNHLRFEISGPGEIVATDNGDATDHTTFSSKERRAYNGLALVIVRSFKGQPGVITVTASSEGLSRGEISVTSR